jgi:subtilisin family serine protease
MRRGAGRWRAVVAGAVVGLLAATGGTGAARAGTATPAGATAASGATRPLGEVTLVTGDVVSVGVEPGGAYTAEVTRAAPRAGGRTVLYSTVRQDGALYVYPSDALGLLGAGRLDRRLFDVEYLVRDGYADATSGALPLIVQYPAADGLARRAAALPAATAVTTLSSVDGAAVRVDKARAADFWAGVAGGTGARPALAGGLSRVWLDGRVTASLDQSVPMIGAPEAWAAGYDGTGVKVAVLDTGIDATHPDFAGHLGASASFVPGGSVRDGHGHGTHVASTIVGSGAASGGKYKGVAPGATLLVGKVLDDTGNGTDSEVIAGMQWAVAQGARVVSMSLGGCCGSDADPMSQAVDELTASSGTLFVVAAGNDGASGPRTVDTPGAATAALTVAAVDKQDELAAFSSRGPRAGDYGLKPDIAAPGVDITAARAAGTTIGPIVDGSYTTLSGTSMATPHVAGSAVLLAEEHPGWPATRLKDALMSTSKDDGYGSYEQGAGRVDVARAVKQGVEATGGVDFGDLPYAQTAPAGRTITYTNDTAAPVTLALAGTLTAHHGTAPAGALRLDRGSVTVPANGTASVGVTFDPAGAPQTWYEGAVRATAAGGVTVTTAVGAYRDLQRVRLTGTVVTPSGATDLSWGGWLAMMLDDRDEVPVFGESDDGAQVSGEIYAGHYTFRTFVRWRDAAGRPNSALLVASDVDATRDASVVFDLRRAQRLTTKLPRPGDPYVQQFGTVSTASGGRSSVTSTIREYGDNLLWTLPTGPKPSLGSFYAYSQRVYTQPRLAMRATGAGTLDARYPVPNALVTDDQIARFTGRSSLRLVYGGNGTDLAGLDLRGKLVLLDLSDLCATTCTGYAADRIAAVAAAGAAGVLGYGSTGRGFLDPDPYDDQRYWPAYPVPTASLDATTGNRLREALSTGPVRVDVDGVASPSTVYALTYPWVDAIPTRIGSTVDSGDLYRVENRLHADNPGVATLSWSAQLPLGAGYRSGDPIRWVGSGNGLPVRAPAVVTTWYGPVRTDLGWNHGASLTYDAPASVPGYHRNGWSDTRTDEFTRPGGRTDDLGAQPLASTTARPSAVSGRYTVPACLSCRNGDLLNPVNVLDSDGTGGGYQAYDITNGTYGDPQTELHLYRDGTELPVHVGIAWIAPPFIGYWNPYFTLPPDQAAYRLTEHYTTAWTMQRYARVVDTAWTFTSGHPSTGYTSPDQGAICMGWYLTLPTRDTCQPTGQLFLGYDLGLALDNTLPAGSTRTVTLSAFHSSLLAGAPRVTGLQAWSSTDGGAHWTPVRTRPLGAGRYAAVLANPRSPGAAVTLRVRATDAAGATVDQTVHDAYGLR